MLLAFIFRFPPRSRVIRLALCAGGPALSAGRAVDQGWRDDFSGADPYEDASVIRPLRASLASLFRCDTLTGPTIAILWYPGDLRSRTDILVQIHRERPSSPAPTYLFDRSVRLSSEASTTKGLQRERQSTPCSLSTLEPLIF